MVKKKQPDFQPAKLRVGKRLPKGRNVTNTSFKSKKIITKDQKLKTFEADTPLSELLVIAKNKSKIETTTVTALGKIGQYVEKHSFALGSDFADILKSVGSYLLSDNDKIRRQTMKLLAECLGMLTTVQMKCFMTLLMQNLDCMMTCCDFDIRRDSLDLMNSFLNTHPSLMCYHTKCLVNLLNLISSIQYSKSPEARRRALVDRVSGKVVSVEWRNKVLNLVAEFLEQLVCHFRELKKPSDDEQRVYWDGKRPLFLQLYAGGGLTPAKLETTRPAKSEDAVTGELRSILRDLVEVLSSITTEELASLTVVSTYNILGPEHIERLNTVSRVLCWLCDWYKMGPGLDNDQEDPEFQPLMNKIISKLLKGFPYNVHESASKEEQKISNEICLHLNLGISYLYSSFIMGTSFAISRIDDLYLAPIASALSQKFNPDTESLTLILKIMRNFIEYMSSGSEFDENEATVEVLSGSLMDLCKVYEASGDRDAIKELQAFFIEISLNFDYKYLLRLDGMKTVFNLILNEMERMKRDRKVDRKLLKCINQICCRQYEPFIEILNSTNHMYILDYLKFEDEDFQFTAMNLITSMTGLPEGFMEDVAKFILTEQYLSAKTVVKFIRLLHDRFLDPRVPREEYLEFVKFLINVGCDYISIDMAGESGGNLHLIEMADVRSMNEMAEENFFQNRASNEEVEKALSLNLRTICHYQILPPDMRNAESVIERHQEIAEVCLECLLLSPYKSCVFDCANGFYRELCDFASNPYPSRPCPESMKNRQNKEEKIFLPVHCAVAMQKFAAKLLKPLRGQECYALTFMREMIVSGLFYISFLTDALPEEKLKHLCIRELQNCIITKTLNIDGILNVLLEKVYYKNHPSGIIIYHSLRIVKFLLTRATEDNLESIVTTLQALESRCENDTPEQRLVFDLFDMIRTLER